MVHKYNKDNLHPPAYHLIYNWTGWPSRQSFPTGLSKEILDHLREPWEGDGFRLMDNSWCPQKIQLTFSVKPHVSPILFTTRVKGRLQHACRVFGNPVDFSRKVSFRSIGKNHADEVQNYVRKQVQRDRSLDSELRSLLVEFTFTDPSVDLNVPTATRSGRYWYNLHMVFTTAGRYRIVDRERLGSIFQVCKSIARTGSHLIADLSVMPDHVHMTMRGNISRTPQEIALEYLNGLTQALREEAIWEFGYYAGSFGEYDLDAVRRTVDPIYKTISISPRCQSSSPAGQAGQGSICDCPLSLGPQSSSPAGQAGQGSN